MYQCTWKQQCNFVWQSMVLIKIHVQWCQYDVKGEHSKKCIQRFSVCLYNCKSEVHLFKLTTNYGSRLLIVVVLLSELCTCYLHSLTSHLKPRFLWYSLSTVVMSLSVGTVSLILQRARSTWEYRPTVSLDDRGHLYPGVAWKWGQMQITWAPLLPSFKSVFFFLKPVLPNHIHYVVYRKRFPTY